MGFPGAGLAPVGLPVGSCSRLSPRESLGGSLTPCTGAAAARLDRGLPTPRSGRDCGPVPHFSASVS